MNQFNHISKVTAVTPTDRLKSVGNRCVIEVFGNVFEVVMLLFGFFCECRGFCHRTESDLFLFLLQKQSSKMYKPFSKGFNRAEITHKSLYL